MKEGQKIKKLKKSYNEMNIGYNDSGCFWTVSVGGRGTGNLIEGCVYKRYTDDYLGKALDKALAYANKK